MADGGVDVVAAAEEVLTRAEAAEREVARLRAALEAVHSTAGALLGGLPHEGRIHRSIAAGGLLALVGLAESALEVES